MKINSKIFNYRTLLFSLIICTIFIKVIYASNKKPISESMSTPTISPDNSNFTLVDDPIQNYFNYLDLTLSKNYIVNNIFINDKGNIEISLSNTLDKKDIKYIKANFDSLDEVFQIYGENQESKTVNLKYNEGSETFEISNNPPKSENVTFINLDKERFGD